MCIDLMQIHCKNNANHRRINDLCIVVMITTDDIRDAIPIMNLFKEMMEVGMPIKSSKAKVHCKVFEDNTGALEIARIPKYRPRTKHLNCRLHHFRSYVDDTKEISIHKIDTEDHPADYLTKPLNEETLTRHRKEVQGW